MNKNIYAFNCIHIKTTWIKSACNKKKKRKERYENVILEKKKRCYVFEMKYIKTHSIRGVKYKMLNT